jgi:hypothetical protein
MECSSLLIDGSLPPMDARRNMPIISYPAPFFTASVVDPVMLLVLGVLLDALLGVARAVCVVCAGGALR